MKHITIMVVIISCMFLKVDAQTRLERRAQKDILKYKGNDSAWIAFSTWGTNRFYLGNKAVSIVEFENTIKGYSLETEALIKKSRKNNQKGAIYELIGLGVMLASPLLTPKTPNRNRWDDAPLSGASLLMASVGFISSTIGVVYQFKARNNFIDGIGEFNKSVKANKSSTSIHIGMQQNGLGFALRF